VSEDNTTRISAQEALRRIERGESLTDWGRVRAMSDAEIESAAARDPDWQDIDPDWVEKAKPVHPVRKRRLTLALHEDVIDWFRSQDRHYGKRINAILPPTWRGTALEGASVGEDRVHKDNAEARRAAEGRSGRQD
jgi:uncharacterized protein (DUF4415 family)